MNIKLYTMIFWTNKHKTFHIDSYWYLRTCISSSSESGKDMLIKNFNCFVDLKTTFDCESDFWNMQ